MKNFSLSQFTRKFLQVAVAIAASFVMLLGVADSAMAFGNSNSQASEGTAQMNQLQKESARAVKSEPRSRRQVQKQAQQGPNEVQGDADLGGMNAPDNSRSTRSVRQQAEDALKKVTPGNS